MNIARNIIIGSHLFPDQNAIQFQSEGLTYSQIENLSGRAAQALLNLGVERGDRVGILIGNVPAFAVWYYACLRIGGVAVAMNTRLTGEEMAFVLSDCETKIVVGTENLLEVLGDAKPDCVQQTFCTPQEAVVDEQESIPEGMLVEMATDDPATILYTSGTTGFPKGATLSHQNVCATIHAFNHLCEMDSDDRILLSVPLFHCYGQNALLNSALNVGATVYLEQQFDLKESIRLIREEKITRLFGVPAMFQMWLDACTPEDLASVKYCFSAAATLPGQVGERWMEKFGLPIYEGYGLTETAPFASYNHRLYHVPGSIGMPVDLVEMRIVDPATKEPCQPDTPGEIAIKGPNVMLGYWNRPEETAEAVQDGWFFSGDIGTMDKRGYFFIVDRVKDMIVVGGLKVYPSEVERVLFDCPGVSDCAVVAAPDHTWGEKVVAYIVTAENGPSEEDVLQHCQQHLATYKVPVHIAKIDQLPRNPAGKVLKTRLREKAAEQWPDQAAEETTTFTEPGPLIEELQQIHTRSRERHLVGVIQNEVQGLLGTEDSPEIDEPLLEMGMDSLQIVNLSNRMQTLVGSEMQVPAIIVFDHPTISDLASYFLDNLQLDPESQEADAAVSSSRTIFEEKQSPSSSVSIQNAKAEIEEMTDEEALDALQQELD